MKMNQTTTASLIQLAAKPFRRGMILGAAILVTATAAFAEEIAVWPFAVDSGKPTSAGAPVLSAESAPKNDWPLTQSPKEGESALLYKESIFESASKYPLMVQFPNLKPELRKYLANNTFNGLVGKKSWRIDMDVSLDGIAPVVLLQIGGTERGAISVFKNFKSGLRISQLGCYDVKLDNVTLESKKTCKLSLIMDEKTLSIRINDEPHAVSSAAVAVSGPGICIGGPASKSYATPVGSISAIRIETTEAAK